jgi:hypothetical protein
MEMPCGRSTPSGLRVVSIMAFFVENEEFNVANKVFYKGYSFSPKERVDAGGSIPF